MSASDDFRNTIRDIEEREGFRIIKLSPLAGGSINKVFLLHTSLGRKVLKLNQASHFPGMFKAEAIGLKQLKETASIDVPKVFSTDEVGDSAYLVLEYKAPGGQHPQFWEIFSTQLAALHKNTSTSFGFPSSNYIGSLPQYNKGTTTASDFYIGQRLEPQIRMAADNGFSFGNLEPIYRRISEAIPQESPALIHGDLWSGNYLINEKGLPCLIDPAVCYGPREMDLAMMKLFGGFPEKVFTGYSSIYLLEPGFDDRIPLWQLYYLLVHLNIFGSSYLPSVKKILKSYS